MARTDTLEHFLTDLADSIREKTGSIEPISAESFDTTIENIPAGDEVYENTVKIFDYNGDIIWAGTKEDFLELTEYPEQPVHQGLKSEGYNISLVDAKNFVTKYGYLNIGAQYSTTDGKEHVFITLPNANTSVVMKLHFCYSGLLTVDWGDGTVENLTQVTTSGHYPTHTYINAGDYEIKVNQTDYEYLSFAVGSAKSAFLVFSDIPSYYQNSLEAYSLAPYVTEVWMSKHYRPSELPGLLYFPNMKAISLSPIEQKNTWTLSSTSLKYVTIPTGWTHFPGINTCSLEYISIPKTITWLDNSQSINLKEVYVLKPDGNSYTAINSNWLQGANNCERLIVDGLFTFSGSGYNGVQNAPLKILRWDSINIIYNAFKKFLGNYIKFTDAYTASSWGIGAEMCSAALVVDLSERTTIISTPPVSWDKCPHAIYVVPDSLYENWIVDSNWSNQANAGRIIKASDYFINSNEAK